MESGGRGSRERIVVSAMGRNQTGVLATIARILADHGVNVEDIEQKLVDELFIMMIIGAFEKRDASIERLNEALRRALRPMGVEIHVQHERLYSYMHRI